MSTEEKTEALEKQAAELLAQNKWGEAIRVLTELIQRQPNAGVMYHARGRAFAHKGDYGSALADFNSAIENNPERAEFYIDRGNCYVTKGEHDRAFADYSTAIEKNPNAAEAYVNRSNCHAAKGEHDRVLADCNRALQVDPQCYGAYYNRGVMRLGRDEYDSAIDDFNQAIRIKPDHTGAIHNRAVALAMKESQNTRKVLEKRLAEGEANLEKELQKRIAEQRQEFEEVFIQGDEERAREEDYSRRLEKTESMIRWGLGGLGVLFPAVFAALFCAVLWSNDWNLPEGFFPFGFIGLVFPTALLVSPLAWWIRTLLRDKAKYAILREDAARKRRVMRYVSFERQDPAFRKEVILKSLDHWTRQSAADLLVDFENKRAAPPAASAPEVKWPSSGDKGE